MAANRTPFIDQIRSVLTGLVIFHHAAITYGASGGWYWREVETLNIPLTLFCAFNQAYFMGFFFLLAGYYTPWAWDRKGPLHFFKDRLLRLGIPLVVYGFILGPITIALTETDITALARMWSRAYFNVGPLWFAEALLIFAVGYGIWRWFKVTPPPITEFPKGLVLLWIALGVGAVAFGVRLVIPVGQAVLGLQIGYFVSYVVLFGLGCWAWSGQWLEKVEVRQAKPWLWGLVIVLPSLPVAIALASNLREALGGWHLLAVFYAFWEPFVAWGVILGMLWQFRVRFNQPSALGTWLAQRAYTVYIIHPPILVGISLLGRGWAAPAFLKFLVVGGLATAVCWALADVILRIPGLRRVL